jgi:hypothetical protein
MKNIFLKICLLIVALSDVVIHEQRLMAEGGEF